MTLDAAKRAVGIAAAGLVEDGMVVGLGTGSTTAHAIEELGRRVKEGLDIRGVPTSFAAEILAEENGISLTSLRDIRQIDVALDGADEVDSDLNLIKGRGGAHTREKVVASLARQFVVLVDETKLVERLGTRMPLPIEVLPMAAYPIKRRLEDLGARPELRMGERKDGPVVTDQGFWIIDAKFDGIDQPRELGTEISTMPGVLDHGLFVHLTSEVLVGANDGGVHRLTREAIKNALSPK